MQKRIATVFGLTGWILMILIGTLAVPTTESTRTNVTYQSTTVFDSALADFVEAPDDVDVKDTVIPTPIPLSVNPTIKNDMGLNWLLANKINGTGITIGVVDTGIQQDDVRFDHDGDLLTTNDYKIIEYYSTVTTEPSYDMHGHGTAVAGVIATEPVPYGGNMISGVAVGVDLVSIKTLDQRGKGNEAQIVPALNYVLACVTDADPTNDIDIVNLSFGHLGNNPAVEEAVRNLWNAGVVVVCAAGNEGYAYTENGMVNPSPVYYTVNTPSSTLEAISVGAMYDGEYMASYSSIGPVPTYNYIKPEVVAPGTWIATLNAGGGQYNVSGTSIASPIVAAGIADVLSGLPYKPSPNAIKSALLDSCIPLGYDMYMEGAGMPNFTRMYHLLMSVDYDRITILPKTLYFPNYFDYEKETEPWDQQQLNPELVNLTFSYCIATLVVGRTPIVPLSVSVSGSIDTYIDVYINNTMSAEGQYPIGVDFVQNGLFKPTGIFYGTIDITEGAQIVAQIEILIEVTLLGSLKASWYAFITSIFAWMLPLIFGIGGALGISKKRKAKMTQQSIAQAITLPEWMDTCPPGYDCKCVDPPSCTKFALFPKNLKL